MQPFQQDAMPRNQFVSDVSGGDFSSQLGHVTANGNLTIRFYYGQVRITDPLDPAANGTFKTVLIVSKRPHGDRATESIRMISERMAQELYPREYAFFKQHQDVPTNGTPLAELPGLTQSQIAILVVHGIRCVEDLMGLHEDQVGQIGMDARSAYAVAKRWTEAKNASGELLRDAAKDAQTTAELERLRASEAKQATMIQQMQAQLDVLTKMGLGGQTSAATAQHGGQTATLVDSDDIPTTSASELFTGPQIVTGNDDLDDEPPAPALPGLDRKRSK